MAECQRCPTIVVEMANSPHHLQQEPHRSEELKPIDSKGKGSIEIVQLSNPSLESKWIAKKIKGLFDKKVQPSDIIVLVQRKRAASVIVEGTEGREGTSQVLLRREPTRIGSSADALLDIQVASQ